MTIKKTIAVQDGDILFVDLYAPQKKPGHFVLLLPKGAVINKKNKARLLNHGVKEVKVV